MSARLSPEERADDSFKCWAFGHEAIKEICIRKHQTLPDVGNPTHARWAKEGFTSFRDLDCVREER